MYYTGEVIYHKDNKRTIEKVPLTGSYKNPTRWNGLGRAGFRRKTFRYGNSPTYIDMEIECPQKCQTANDCILFALWSGNTSCYNFTSSKNELIRK